MKACFLTRNEGPDFKDFQPVISGVQPPAPKPRCSTYKSQLFLPDYATLTPLIFTYGQGLICYSSQKLSCKVGGIRGTQKWQWLAQNLVTGLLLDQLRMHSSSRQRGNVYVFTIVMSLMPKHQCMLLAVLFNDRIKSFQR